MLTTVAAPDQVAALIMIDIAPRISLGGVARIRAFMQGHPEGFATLEDAAAAVETYNPSRTKSGRNAIGLMKNLRLREDGRLRWHWDPAILDESPTETTTQMLMQQCGSIPAKVPTLLVWGEQSDVLEHEAIEDFRDRAAHAEIAVLSDAGHMAPNQKNDAFNDAIVAFIHRNMAQPSRKDADR